MGSGGPGGGGGGGGFNDLKSSRSFAAAGEEEGARGEEGEGGGFGDGGGDGSIDEKAGEVVDGGDGVVAGAGGVGFGDRDGVAEGGAEAEDFFHGFDVGGVVHFDGAGEGISFGEWGEDDFADGLLSGVAAFGLVEPNDDGAVVFVGIGGLDGGDDLGEEMVADGDGLLVGIVGEGGSVVGEIGVEGGVHIVVLVGGDPVVFGEGVAGDIGAELVEIFDVLGGGVGEEGHGVMLDGVVELAGVVVGVDGGGGGSGSAVGGARAELDVFLVVVPGDAGGVHLGGEVGSGEDIVAGGAGVGIGVDAEVSAGFGPDVVGFGGVDADAGVEVVGGEGGLGGVGIAGGDEGVDVWGGGVAEDLLRGGGGDGLGEVVIFHGDHEDIANLGNGGARRRGGGEAVQVAAASVRRMLTRMFCMCLSRVWIG